MRRIININYVLAVGSIWHTSTEMGKFHFQPTGEHIYAESLVIGASFPRPLEIDFFLSFFLVPTGVEYMLRVLAS